MRISAIKKKAHALFDQAGFLVRISTQDEYEQALKLMDALVEDYEDNRALIEILSVSIDKWEESSPEFTRFNKRIKTLDTSEAILRILMEQYKLGVADFPEIGSKSLVSKILNHERNLTREHIAALSKRFKIDPSLFF